MDTLESLNHSVWDCKDHVVFIPKCRRCTASCGGTLARCSGSWRSRRRVALRKATCCRTPCVALQRRVRAVRRDKRTRGCTNRRAKSETKTQMDCGVFAAGLCRARCVRPDGVAARRRFRVVAARNRACWSGRRVLLGLRSLSCRDWHRVVFSGSLAAAALSA